jgi:hypothetical protein
MQPYLVEFPSDADTTSEESNESDDDYHTLYEQQQCVTGGLSTGGRKVPSTCGTQDPYISGTQSSCTSGMQQDSSSQDTASDKASCRRVMTCHTDTNITTILGW